MNFARAWQAVAEIKALLTEIRDLLKELVESRVSY